MYEVDQALKQKPSYCEDCFRKMNDFAHFDAFDTKHAVYV